MEEDNFEEESLEEEANSREETEEELENIIDETESIPFRQEALEKILPILQPRETAPQTLEQGVANIIINEDEENKEEPGVYDLLQATKGLGYDATAGDYQSSSSVYDQPSQEFTRTSGMSPRINGIQDPFSQESQQGTIYQTETKEETELKKDRERRVW